MTTLPVKLTTSRNLADLPKAHLHTHLEGCARAATMSEFATKAGLTGPDEMLGGFNDLSSFLNVFEATCAAITSVADLVRIATEFVEDEAAQGVLYTEPMFGPFWWSRRLGIPSEEIWAPVHEAFQTTGRKLGVTVRYLGGVDKSWPPEWMNECVESAISHRLDGVVGFGAGGDESIPLSVLVPHFELAQRAGLFVVPHAGEVMGPAIVREAVMLFSPRRIAHGIRATEDPEVLALLSARGIACDVCITSNVRLGVYRSVHDHPLAKMLEAGVPVTLNTDDQLFFGSLLANEYEVARTQLGLNDSQLADIARTSFAFSGAPESLKKQAYETIARWLG